MKLKNGIGKIRYIGVNLRICFFVVDLVAQTFVELHQADAEPQRKMSPAQRSRAAKKKMLFYLTAEQVRYLDTMAGLMGTSKQEFLEGILQEHIDNDTAYKKALKLRKELQKETQKNG